MFPIIVIGMTAGAPLGSFIAGHLFRTGVTPNVILQISAALLLISAMAYLWINNRHERQAGAPEPMMSAADGFKLVLLDTGAAGVELAAAQPFAPASSET